MELIYHCLHHRWSLADSTTLLSLVIVLSPLQLHCSNNTIPPRTHTPFWTLMVLWIQSWKSELFFFPTKDLCWLNFFFFGKPNYVDKIIMQESVKSHPGPSCLTSGFILCDPEIKFSLPVSRGRKSPVLRSSTQTCYHVSSWLDSSVLFWLLILLWMRSLDLFVIKCLGFSKYFRWGGLYIYYI